MAAEIKRHRIRNEITPIDVTLCTSGRSRPRSHRRYRRAPSMPRATTSPTAGVSPLQTAVSSTLPPGSLDAASNRVTHCRRLPAPVVHAEHRRTRCPSTAAARRRARFAAGAGARPQAAQRAEPVRTATRPSQEERDIPRDAWRRTRGYLPGRTLLSPFGRRQIILHGM